MATFKTAILVIILAFGMNKLPDLMRSHLPVGEPQGFVKAGWEPVERAFRDNFKERGERGSAFAVYHRGELVVNLWGGLANEMTHYYWNNETVTRLYSSSKGMGAIVMAMLVDRGLMKYEEKVSNYWPEFAANGKRDITVAQLLSHQAGLFVLDEPYSEFDTLYDWPKIKGIMERQKPHWTPGEARGYHAFTIGLFMDQLVRLRDPKHRTMAQFFEEEVAQPFDIDASFGIRKSEHHRCTWLVTLPLTISDFLNPGRLISGIRNHLDPNVQKWFQNPPDIVTGPLEHNPEYRMLNNPSHAGYGSARGMAKLYSVLANGGHMQGKVLIKNRKIIQQLNTVLTSDQQDEYVNTGMVFGYGMTPLATPEGGVMFGTPGHGGQMCYADTENNLGFALVTNYLDSQALMDFPKYNALKDAMYKCIEYL